MSGMWTDVVVVIRAREGEVAGLGVLVDRARVVTCAHVVRRAQGRGVGPDGDGGRPGVEAGGPLSVRVELVLREQQGDRSLTEVWATVSGWDPPADGDLAVLIMPRPAPDEAEAAFLADADVMQWPRPLQVFGYPEGRPRGQWTEVRAVGVVGGGRVQLGTVDEVLPSVRAGYSGSPVRDPRSGAVFALVTEAPDGGRAQDSLAVPASTIRAFLAASVGGLPTGSVASGRPTTGLTSGGGTDCGRRRPRRSYAPAAELTVLHVSELRFGSGHGFDGTGPAAAECRHDIPVARLHEDLGRLADVHGLWPDLMVVTGDLTQQAAPSEFEQAGEFLAGVVEAVGLPRHRVVMVPGNHDISRAASRAYFATEESFERNPVPPYALKWRNFHEAFQRFYAEFPDGGGEQVPAFVPEQRPWTLFEMPEVKVAVAGLNSTLADSHRDGDHYGWVGEKQLAWFAESVRDYRDAGWLVLGAVHHEVAEAGDGEGARLLRDVTDLDRLLGYGAHGYPERRPGPLHLLLHGSAAVGGLHRLGSGLPVVSVGGAGVGSGSGGRPEVARRYQYLTLRRDGLSRYPGTSDPDHRTSIGADRAAPARDRWHTDGPVSLVAPAALAAPQDGPRVPAIAGPEEGDALGGVPGSVPWGTELLPASRWDLANPAAVRDRFLDQVATVARLRHEPARIQLFPATVPGSSHLVVTRTDPYGPVEVWPVGAVDGPVHESVLRRFVAQVHRPRQAMDTYLRSHLVYSGAEPGEQVRRAARREGVQLHSMAEYRGLIDLSRLRARQQDQLFGEATDHMRQLYEPQLYVPQRFRQQHPVLHRDEDGAPAVETGALDRLITWLGEPGARFATVLGDFGWGKTFLMLQLVRRLPEAVGSVEPLLIQLRTLEKGPDLFDLLGQHLHRLDIGDVTDAKVRHMVEHGRVAVLLDGYDELVQKVTYPTADAYLATLLEAATGEAKIVLTSRTQHFRDDGQIHKALLGRRAGRDAARVLALEDFSDTQVLDFLTRLYGGDARRARERFDHIEGIRDLLGLSRNPRMLAFIAGLPDDRLDEAARSGQALGAAELYREILDHWLDGEVKRQRPSLLGTAPLGQSARLDACRELAHHLWTSPGTGQSTVTAEDLVATTAATLTELERQGFTPEQAGYAIGCQSLLTRVGGGFDFIHHSVMEWLVADTAATALHSGQEPTLLGLGRMSDLMTDFFCDLAGHHEALAWADATLRRVPADRPAAESAGARQANATRVRARLQRRAGQAGVEQPSGRTRTLTTSPGASLLDLRDQDLRDQDLPALALGRPGGHGLDGAILRQTIWTGIRLTGTSLAAADLTGADLTEVDLGDVDLSRARLAGARLVDARLTRVTLSGADLTGADLSRARLVDIDLGEATVDGCHWSGAAVLGGRFPRTLIEPGSPTPVAFAGHDPATAVLRCATEARRATGLPGTDLLAVARGHAIELVDLRVGQPLRTLTGHTGPVWSVAAVGLPGGRTLLASGGGDGRVRFWDPVDGTRCGEPLLAHDGGVWSLAVVGSLDGRMLLVSGGGDGRVRFWDPVDGTQCGEPLLAHDGGVWSLAVVELLDGRTLLVSGGGDGRVQVWDPASGAPRGAPLAAHAGPVWSLATVGSPQGRPLLLSGGNDGTVRLWDPATGARAGEPSAGQDGGMWSLAALGLPGGRTVLASGGGDGWVRLWDPVTGTQRGEPLIAHTGGVWSLVVVGLPGGRTVLASGGGDGWVRMWDPVTGTQCGEPLIGHRGRVLAVAVAGLPDGRTVLASGGGDGSVRLWDPGTGAPLGRPLLGHAGSVWSLATVVLPDGRTLLASGGDDGYVRLWDLATGTPFGRPLAGHRGRVLAVAAVGLPDGRTVLASGGSDRSVRMWDPGTGAPLGRPLPGHSGSVWSLTPVVLPDGRTLLASGGGDGSVRLWDPGTGAPVGEPLTGHRGRVWSAEAVSLPDGRTLLACGSGDGSVRLWRLEVPRPRREPALWGPLPGPSRGLRRRGPWRRPSDPAAEAVPAPQMCAEHVATLAAGRQGWAMLRADDRSYKVGGDAGDLLWWVIKAVRFEAGELDPYDSSIHRLDHNTPIV